jgi:hypothetical protein
LLSLPRAAIYTPATQARHTRGGKGEQCKRIAGGRSNPHPHPIQIPLDLLLPIAFVTDPVAPRQPARVPDRSNDLREYKQVRSLACFSGAGRIPPPFPSRENCLLACKLVAARPPRRRFLLALTCTSSRRAPCFWIARVGMSTSGHPRARAWFLSISIDLARARLSFVLWLCLWMVGDELGSIGPAGELTLLLIYRGLDFLLCVRAVRACVRACERSGISSVGCRVVV